MKKSLILAISVFSVMLFSACSSMNSLVDSQKTFANACVAVNADLSTIANSSLLGEKQQQVLKNEVMPANQALCSAGTGVNLSNLRAFHDSLLPIAIAIVQANPAIPQQTAILLGLQTFGPIVQQLIDQFIPSTSAAAATPASSVQVLK